MHNKKCDLVKVSTALIFCNLLLVNKSKSHFHSSQVELLVELAFELGRLPCCKAPCIRLTCSW